jgi:hypothetical protein
VGLTTHRKKKMLRNVTRGLGLGRILGFKSAIFELSQILMLRLLSSFKERKQAHEITMLSVYMIVCLSSFQLLMQLKSFHKVWYRHYGIRGLRNLSQISV